MCWSDVGDETTGNYACPNGCHADNFSLKASSNNKLPPSLSNLVSTSLLVRGDGSFVYELPSDVPFLIQLAWISAHLSLNKPFCLSLSAIYFGLIGNTPSRSGLATQRLALVAIVLAMKFSCCLNRVQTWC